MIIMFDIGRYILEARKRALAKKKKLRSLGKRAQSADSEDEMEVDGKFFKQNNQQIFKKNYRGQAQRMRWKLKMS